MFNEWTPWQRGHINDTSLIKGTVTTPARHSVPGMEREREKERQSKQVPIFQCTYIYPSAVRLTAILPISGPACMREEGSVHGVPSCIVFGLLLGKRSINHPWSRVDKY